MYVAGLGITHVDFVFFGVLGGIEIVKVVGGAEEVAFAIFGVLEGVQVPATAPQLSFGIAKKVDAKRVGDIILAAEVASTKERNSVGGEEIASFEIV